MHVYQVIKHEYNSDDGHYDHDPVDDIVYANEADAIRVRDALNLEEVNQNNDHVLTEVAHMARKRSEPDFVEPERGRDKHGCRKPPPYLSKEYIKVYTDTQSRR